MTDDIESDNVLFRMDIDNLQSEGNEMSIEDIFGPGSNVDRRYIENHEKLVDTINKLRGLKADLKLVLTMGGFDLQHVGHFRYLELAKNAGDLLVVGLDSDQKLKIKKGEDRPINHLSERVETLAHLRHVDLITAKHSSDPKYNLITLLQPDVLIATEGTYNDEQIVKLRELFPKVDIQVLPPQATTSTSAKIRRLYMFLVDKILGPIEKLQSDLSSIQELLKSVGGENNNERK